DTRQTGRDVLPRDATRVEGPHRELRPRLADRLRGHDPHRLADVHEPPRRERPSVAEPADAVLRLARRRRPDTDRVDAGLDQALRALVVEEVAPCADL